MFTLFFALFVLAGISNCKKSNEILLVSIIGKWKLTEIYQDYNGGDLKWTTASYSYTCQFGQNGSFKDSISVFRDMCSPISYSKKDSLLIYTLDCNQKDTGYIQKLSNDTLILKYKVIGGNIKQKFYKIK